MADESFALGFHAPLSTPLDRPGSAMFRKPILFISRESTKCLAACGRSTEPPAVDLPRNPLDPPHGGVAVVVVYVYLEARNTTERDQFCCITT